MADELDAFLDEIDTLEAGDGAPPDAGGSAVSAAPATSSQAASAAPRANPSPSAVISMPPVKASDPTRAVYAAKPVRNDVQPVVPAGHEDGPPAAAASHPPFGGLGAAGAPQAMPPQMFSHQSAPPIPPPPVHHQPPPPPVPLPHMAPQAPVADKKDPEAEKKRKIMRMGGDKIWKDDSLADWPDDDYRLFCGNLGNEVDDSTLARTFNKYASFQKAKVIRDQRTKKSKGYGFVSLGDPADFTRAIRELNGKYVGNRPIKLSKSEWQDRQLVANIKKRPKMNPSSAKKHI